ncbi:MAG TPA: FAD-dependent oxidoreductase [Pseudonocardia sp.]|jgi:2-polyprenyl-6-methoxyphenol hydroxylase-like FAD-dependent oxidoreductase|nr:FAD-dependent oxidoreductase [Pseudonocardia sp.]
MRVAIVGAGPTGLFTSLALARRGHAVVVVDRDTGPAPDGRWRRAGVMQFHHPHAFRGQVVEALRAEAPEVLDALLAAGAEPAVLPDAPDRILGLRCRRMTFERVLRAAVVAEPGVTLHHGHAEEVLTERGRAAGLRVDGQHIEADLVLDASGRSGRLGRGLRAPEVGADCGIAYVSRQYVLRPGAELGPMQSPIASAAVYPGYLTIVFPHDNGVFSALIGRSTQDRALVGLRENAAYEAAAAAIPLIAEWTDPTRSRPLTDVLPGGRLYNTYRGQLNAAGAVPVPGLVFVGDAVCTTNPAAGRGITTSLLQARRLIELIDEHGADHETTTLAFDAWCTEAIRPWFEDHVANDTDLTRRWTGGDVDLDRPLPSDLITAVAAVDPSLMRVIGPYFGMQALPSSLRAIEPRAREIYAGGWRPPVPDGPDRAELVELVGGVAVA